MAPISFRHPVLRQPQAPTMRPGANTVFVSDESEEFWFSHGLYNIQQRRELTRIREILAKEVKKGQSQLRKKADQLRCAMRVIRQMNSEKTHCDSRLDTRQKDLDEKEVLLHKSEQALNHKLNLVSEEAHDKLKADLDSTQSDVEKCQMELSNKTESLVKMTTNRNDLLEQLAAAKVETAMFKSKSTHQEGYIAELKGDLESVKSDLERGQSDLVTTSVQLDEVASACDVSQKSLASTQEQLATSESKNVESIGTIMGLKHSLACSQANLRSTESELESTKIQRDDATTACDDLQILLASSQESQKEDTSNFMKLTAKHEDLRNSLISVREKLEIALATIEIQKIELAKLQGQRKEVSIIGGTGSHKVPSTGSAILEKEQQTLTPNKMTRLQTQLAGFYAQILQKEEMLELQNSKIEWLTGLCSDLHTKRSIGLKRTCKLSKQLEKAQREVRDGEWHITDLKHDRDQALEDLTKTRIVSAGDKTVLQQDLDKLEKSHAVTAADATIKASRIDQLERTISHLQADILNIEKQNFHQKNINNWRAIESKDSQILQMGQSHENQTQEKEHQIEDLTNSKNTALKELEEVKKRLGDTEKLLALTPIMSSEHITDADGDDNDLHSHTDHASYSARLAKSQAQMLTQLFAKVGRLEKELAVAHTEWHDLQFENKQLVRMSGPVEYCIRFDKSKYGEKKEWCSCINCLTWQKIERKHCHKLMVEEQFAAEEDNFVLLEQLKELVLDYSQYAPLLDYFQTMRHHIREEKWKNQKLISQLDALKPAIENGGPLRNDVVDHEFNDEEVQPLEDVDSDDLDDLDEETVIITEEHEGTYERFARAVASKPQEFAHFFRKPEKRPITISSSSSSDTSQAIGSKEQSAKLILIEGSTNDVTTEPTSMELSQPTFVVETTSVLDISSDSISAQEKSLRVVNVALVEEPAIPTCEIDDANESVQPSNSRLTHPASVVIPKENITGTTQAPLVVGLTTTAAEAVKTPKEPECTTFEEVNDISNFVEKGSIEVTVSAIDVSEEEDDYDLEFEEFLKELEEDRANGNTANVHVAMNDQREVQKLEVKSECHELSGNKVYALKGNIAPVLGNSIVPSSVITCKPLMNDTPFTPVSKLAVYNGEIPIPSTALSSIGSLATAISIDTPTPLEPRQPRSLLSRQFQDIRSVVQSNMVSDPSPPATLETQKPNIVSKEVVAPKASAFTTTARSVTPAGSILTLETLADSVPNQKQSPQEKKTSYLMGSVHAPGTKANGLIRKPAEKIDPKPGIRTKSRHIHPEGACQPDIKDYDHHNMQEDHPKGKPHTQTIQKAQTATQDSPTQGKKSPQRLSPVPRYAGAANETGSNSVGKQKPRLCNFCSYEGHTENTCPNKKEQDRMLQEMYGKTPKSNAPARTSPQQQNSGPRNAQPPSQNKTTGGLLGSKYASGTDGNDKNGRNGGDGGGGRDDRYNGSKGTKGGNTRGRGQGGGQRWNNDRRY